MIFIIEDDEIISECLARATGQDCRIFTNGIEAMSAIDEEPPSLIFLDVLLDGPDGFTFLNELASYSDLSKIPVVLVTSLELHAEELSDYGVVGLLDKSTMTPKEIESYVRHYC